MRKRKFHLITNWVLYVICQILGWKIIGTSGEELWIVFIMIFLYSFMMTTFYKMNKSTIQEFYESIKIR